MIPPNKGHIVAVNPNDCKRNPNDCKEAVGILEKKNELYLVKFENDLVIEFEEEYMKKRKMILINN